jgi:hypothetical protein
VPAARSRVSPALTRVLIAILVLIAIVVLLAVML